MSNNQKLTEPLIVEIGAKVVVRNIRVIAGIRYRI